MGTLRCRTAQTLGPGPRGRHRESDERRPPGMNGATESACGSMEEVAQAAAVSAAEVHEAAVLQDDAVVAVVPGLDLADLVYVHDVPPVHPGKALLVQPLLQGDEGLPQRVGRAAHVEAHVVTVRLDALYVLDVEDELAVELAHHQPLQGRTFRLCVPGRCG